jgi:hypothetical protein
MSDDRARSRHRRRSRRRPADILGFLAFSHGWTWCFWLLGRDDRRAGRLGTRDAAARRAGAATTYRLSRDARVTRLGS